MIESLITYLKYGLFFCSIEIISTLEEDFFIKGIITKKKGGEFKNISFFTAKNFLDFSKKLPKLQHCFLQINSQEVLVKSLEGKINEIDALKQAFPEINYQDFFYEIVYSSQSTIISICRKKYISQLIELAQKNSINIIGFNLGFSSFINLIPLVENPIIETPRFKFILKNNQIISFEENFDYKNNTYIIEDIPIKGEYLISLSGIFNYVIKNETLNNFKDLQGLLKKEFFEKYFLRKGISLGVILLLTSLLINFFIFNDIFSDLQQKEKELQIKRTEKQNFYKKSKSIREKEKNVKYILNSRNSISSFFINKIITVKPQSILLNELVYNPLKGKLIEEKNIDYIGDTIVIKGEINNLNDFSQWIEILENFEWTNNVLVDNFGSSINGKFNFIITIHIKEK
jgi:hypothetical protein